ncbi:MAG: glycerol kinase GlpK, partial [Betaproteobacteria bacterium]|nr:glycerol kinase GlpK [Betaproteobacteria bacterium]
DTRTDALVREVAQRHGPQGWRDRTGLPPANYFSACKLQWLLREHGASEAARRGDALFGTIDSWLAWRLTGGPRGGVHVTDVTNASRTNLFDIRRLAWDAEILDALNIPGACLPRVGASSQRLGRISEGALAGVELCALLGDQQAAMIGQACFEPGQAKVTHGTGSFLLMHTGAQPVDSSAGLLSTIAYQFGTQAPCYALEGSIAVTGSLVGWLRDNLGLIRQSSDIEALAASVPDNGDVYFVPAFSGLFAPHWRPDARGVLVGLTHHSNRAHVARAALEATAYQLQQICAVMQRESGMALRELKVDGGMSANDLLMQFQADLLDTEVVCPQCAETTALGAAYAAGLAVGIWRDTAQLQTLWRARQRWHPAMAAPTREHLLHRWESAIQRSLGWTG